MSHKTEPVDDQIKPKDKFDKWTVVEFVGKHRTKSPAGHRRTTDMWKCRCACGTVRDIARGNLLRKMTTRCKACSCIELVEDRKAIDPDSKRQNLAISGKYRRVRQEGCVAAWDWLAFLHWFRKLAPEQQVGVPVRRDAESPHSQNNTYFVRNPIRTGHIAVIAEMCGLTIEAATEWSAGVSRQAVEMRANKLRGKKVGV